MKNLLLLISFTIFITSFVYSQDSADSVREAVREAARSAAKSQVAKSDESDKSLPNLTYEKFKQIQINMLYETVRDIIGADGERLEGDKESIRYEWEGEKSARIIGSFQNGKLVSVSQTNLKEERTIDLTYSKFDRLPEKMSYEAVSAILESEGEIIMKAQVEDTILISYIWKGPEFQMIRAGFRNNQLITKSQSGLKKEAVDKTQETSKTGNSQLTYEIFQQITLGMDYETVKAIMGGEGIKISTSNSRNFESEIYQWKGDKFARINVRFQNGKLVSQSQSNLTDQKGDAVLTQDKYNQIIIGMSYEFVKAILGSDGELTRISKIGDSTLTSYTWKGPKFERVFASFKNDKLTNKTQSGLK